MREIQQKHKLSVTDLLSFQRVQRDPVAPISPSYKDSLEDFETIGNTTGHQKKFFEGKSLVGSPEIQQKKLSGTLTSKV